MSRPGSHRAVWRERGKRQQFKTFPDTGQAMAHLAGIPNLVYWQVERRSVGGWRWLDGGFATPGSEAS